MKNYDFDLFLQAPEDPAALHADEFLDMVEDALFEEFHGDVTPGLSGGVPVLTCTIEADSIEAALDRVGGTVLRLGLHPAQLLMRLNGGRYALA